MEKFPEIPEYQIIKELGEGGMGKIYLAKDLIFNRKVALKVLMPSHPSYKTGIARFQYEGKALKKMNHTNIINVYDIGKSGDIYYLSMEYLKGRNLKERIIAGKGKGLDEKDVVNILKKIAGALEYAHKMGIIHRDIKPENILFRDENTPVLADFGIVKDLSADKSLTVTGTSMGTPYYMSPEQIKGYEPDERNDIYSLGVVFYEMLTGKVPYDADDLISIALKHEKAPVPTLPGKYKKFQRLIDKMMSKKRESRLKSGTEIIRLVDLCLEENNKSKKRKFEKIVRFKILKVIMIFLLVFLVPLIGGYFFLNEYGVSPKGSRDRETYNKKIKVPEKIRKKTKRKPLKSHSPSIRLKPDVYLTSRYRSVDQKRLKRILGKFNFYDSNLNNHGNFINKFKTRIVGQDKVVVDKATLLMWDQRGSFYSMTYPKVKKWIKELNREKYAGYNDWRLPTLEEAYSILEKRTWYGGLHIFTVFSAIQTSIWTGDFTEDSLKHWIIDFKKGRARTPSFFKKKAFVKVVRGIKK